MAVDHNRPLPVHPERLRAVAKVLYPNTLWPQNFIAAEVYTVALLGEQVEAAQQIVFGLQNAHDIYNTRFR